MNNPQWKKEDLERLTLGAIQYQSLEAKYNNLKSQMHSFGSLFKGQLDKLRSTGVRFEHESALETLLKGDNIQVSVVNGLVNVVEYRERVVEVPISDARTKHLVHLLAVQMKKMFEKYPKLRLECD